MTPAEQLCLACGLCCDGTLFHHVRLEPGDDAAKLKALGLPVRTSRGATPVTRFRQPCAALCADRSCRLYADRPGQCRSFECGVFQDVRAGRMEAGAALRLVKQARRQADDVRRLLRALGDTDEHHAMNERFRRTKRRLEAGGADPADMDTFAELSLAMHHLSLLTIDKFYTKAGAK
ncbi:Flagellin N-methylase [Lacunisphaera limnophila]|uniref:Flagellin N-methylase n=1 Tax=Lacunisphaera limnophila TaxID=1838286 RepID=A0A1I7PHA0_9BACT|nr:YkgJ family cysteine cluster protein [Lacunisphaera limnophila]AOS42973.1 Flagellin N-methylase [Lacunisphaera limnophila]